MDDLNVASSQDLDLAIDRVNNQAPTLASSAANDNPDDGVEAGKLSNITGAPTTTVLGDLKGFRAQVKSAMAADLVRQNDFLGEYVRSHPMAPVVSNDDYGNLDQFSKGAQDTMGTFRKVQPPADAWQLTKDLAVGAATGAWAGFKEGWGGEPFMYMLASRPYYQNRESWPLASAGWVMAEAAQRTMSGIFGAVTQGAEQATQKGVFDLTGDQNLSQRLSREVAGITEQKMIEVPQHPAEVTAAAGNAARAMDAIAAAKPYIDAGVDVPRGVHPLWDEMKAATNEHGLMQLNNDLAAAQESLTRDRSSDMFQRFAQQHYGDAEIGVSGDAVASLYGDRTPSPGDGLLGWVPGIEDKLALARETGTDVSVPVADWVTKVDPAVAAQLNDHVRIWPGGITRFEGADPLPPMRPAPVPTVPDSVLSAFPDMLVADGGGIGINAFTDAEQAALHNAGLVEQFKTEEGVEYTGVNPQKLWPLREQRAAELAGRGQVRQVIDAPLPQVRGAMWSEPQFALGDRKLTLDRIDPVEDGAKRLAMDQGVSWDVLSEGVRQQLRDAAETTAGRFGPAAGFHDFQLVNENGEAVGYLNLSQRDPKNLYVEMVEAKGGAQGMGPSLMRDLLKQIAAEFPEAETLSGHRVTGARDAANSWEMPSAFPKIDLRRIRTEGEMDVGASRNLQQLLQNGEWKSIGPNVRAYWKPFSEYTPEAQQAIRDVNDFLQRVAPTADFKPVVTMRARAGAGGLTRGATVTGMHIVHNAQDAQSLILMSLDSTNPIGTAAHEAIHHLRQMKFFTPVEWKILEDAATKHGWAEQFNIDARYGGATNSLRLEEAIAEAYRTWRTGAKVTPEVEGVFQKLKQMLDQIREVVARAFGRQVTWQDLFERVESGEVGARTPGERLSKVGDLDTTFQREALDHARGRDNEAELLKQRIRQIDYDRRLSGTPRDATDPGRAEKDAIRQRLKELEGRGEPQVSFQTPEEPTKGKPEPPLRPGYTRVYNSGMLGEGGRWVSTSREYASNYRPDLPLNYLDLPENDPRVNNPDYPEQGTKQGFHFNFELTPAEAANLQTIAREAEASGIQSRGNLDSQLDALKASGMGLDAKSYGLLQDAIKRQYDADIAAAEKRALREQKKTQTQEWKANEKDVRKEIEERLRARPDIAADHFLGSGVLYGNKLDKKYKLLTSDLTDEQKAALGSAAHSKTGLPVDQVAKLFGFTSGDAMVTALSRLREARGKLTPEEHLGQMTRSLASQEMERRYGSLDDNIMDAAKDQALSDASLDLMAQETYTAAQMANVPLVDKARMQAWVKEQFGKLTMSGIDSDRLMDTMAKHGRDAERQLIAGDSAGAVVSLQRKYAAALLAREARDIRKEKASFDKIAKRFAKREVKGIDVEYTNYIHQILQAVGQKVRRSVADLEKEIGATQSKDLETFVLTKSGMLRAMPVWPQLYDKSWSKEFPALTTDEFRAVHGSLKTLVENGRDEQRIFSAGQAADLADIRAQMVAALKTFREKAYDIDGKPLGPVASSWLGRMGRMALASHIQIETLLNRWDRFDPKGPFNQFVMRDLIAGANDEAAMRKVYARRIADLHDGLDLNKLVTNTIFREPNGDGTFGGLFTMTRKNLRAVMLNMGTESNLAKLAKGYGLTPDAIINWVHSQARMEDWDFAQKVWDMFKDVKDRSDTMYRSISGVPSQDIPARAVQTPFGTYRGGYYPVIYHPEFKGTSAKLMGGALEQEGYFHASPAAGYMESRTGYAAPMSLNLDFLPSRLSQMIHDIALRPALINASKIFYDKGLQEAIRKHYGTEFRDQLIPYLQNVANGMNFKSRDAAAWQKWSEFLRQNMISTLVGFNPGTVLKHGPTALVQSMKEVGAKNFLSEALGVLAKDPASGERNWDFAMGNSEELQRRDQHWQETLTGATESLAPTSGLGGLRKNIMRLASKPVAFSDLLSAVPTWLAEYKRQVELGEAHGDAVAMADRAVRRAHGSSAITNRPGVMRDVNPWFTSVYNFFNHIMNRQVEAIWKAGDALDLAKEGQYGEALKQTWGLKGDLFAYVIAPAVFEELVSPMTNDEKESWALKAAKGVAYTLSASWIFGRDIAHSILSGGDPAVGLMQTGAKEMKGFWDDIHKPHPMSQANAGKTLQDAVTLVGTITGMAPAQVGREVRAMVGNEHPRGPWGWLVKLRYGTLNKHSKTFDEWQRSYLH